MTQFILPSASISVTIVIPYDLHYSPGVRSHQILWAAEGDFGSQLGATWQEVLEAPAFGKQRWECFKYSLCLYEQKPTTKKLFAFPQWEAAWSLASSPIVREFYKEILEFRYPEKAYKENKDLGVQSVFLEMNKQTWPQIWGPYSTFFFFWQLMSFSLLRESQLINFVNLPLCFK